MSKSKDMEQTDSNEIILYQPDSTLSLDVRVEDETVWLNQAQMAELFQATKQNISLHINNVFKEGELQSAATVKEYLTVQTEGTRTIRRNVRYYNLDVIISVGYRVKSLRGTMFRQWANKILKDYLLRGYSVNQRLLHMESRIDHRLSEHDSQLKELSGKVDFILKTSLPPKEGVLFDGQIFDAYVFVSDLIRRAKKGIVLIDNYIDESVLVLLNKRGNGVNAIIYTHRLTRNLQLDIERHANQYRPVDIRTTSGVHDRFLIIDDILYHIGASIKDLGKKLFAFSKMNTPASEIFDRI